MPNHGITLVALVITIIVLVILVGVTINAIIQQGLISNAERAVEAYDTAQKEEEQWLAEVEGIQEANENKWTGEIAANYAEGEGTQQNPYLIETPEQLAYLAQQVNGGETYEGTYFEITKSMSLENNKWTPIGTGIGEDGSLNNWSMEIKFKGNIDGKNHVITNLKIEELNMRGVGLFGILDEGGSIKNIQVISGEVSGLNDVGGIVGASKGNVQGCINRATITAIPKTGPTYVGQVAGGVVGYNIGTIRNCRNSGKVTTKYQSGTNNSGIMAGGIVGLMRGGTITECSNSGEIIAESQEAGGIVGWNQSNGSVTNCNNSGTVTAQKQSGVSSTGLAAGGIVGYNQTGTIVECSNAGEIIAGYQEAGGIAGWNGSNGSVTNCNNSGTVTAKAQSGVSNSGLLAGGIVGYNQTGTITECSNSGEIIAENQETGGIVGRNASNGSVTKCSNSGTVIAQMQSGVSYSGSIAGGVVGSNQTGTITECSNSGEIIAENQQAGGIVGWNLSNGSVTNCSNGGTVTAKAQSGVSNSGLIAGGIAGRNTTGTVTECSNTGEIIAGCQQAGGIAGLNESNGIVTNCSNSGTVRSNSTGGRGLSGGIVGCNDASKIEECYHQGEVTVGNYASGVDAAGGIVGLQISGGSIISSYHTGNIEGEAKGGIIGQYNTSTSAEIARCYYCGDNIEAGIGSSGTNNTVIVETADTKGSTEKVEERLDTYEEFSNWIAGKK